MSHENIDKTNAAQTGVPYGDMGPGYVNRGDASYNNNWQNNSNMVYPGYGYQNYGGPAPRANYQPNYANPAQGVYRGNYAPYGRGYASNYPYNVAYVGPHEGDYDYHYHHDDHDDHYDHPYYYGYGEYNMPPGMGQNRMYPQYSRPYNMPPGMGRYRMYHQYYHGQPYFDGYGSGNQGTWGFLRNWFAYNPVTNWVSSPRGSNFLRGLGIATAGIILAPAVVKTLRPLAVQAVHGVMSIVGEVRGVVADAREELEDIFADAKWENLSEKEQISQEGE